MALPKINTESTTSAYDQFASAYDHLFAPEAVQGTLRALDCLLFSELRPGAVVLDMCCGTGRLSKEMLDRGYHVVGVDVSEEMLARARRRVVSAEFVQADVRQFRLGRRFDAVVCAYNSLPHITEPGDLAKVFCNVRDAVKSGGKFVFDLYLESAYEERWRGSFARVEDDHVCVVRASYDRAQRRGTNLITFFQKNDAWQRSDVTLVTRSYSERELRAWLGAAGFRGIECYEGARTFGCEALSGRVFWSCSTE